MTDSDKKFCIIRIRKVKKHSLTASQIHNERLTDRHSNSDIDTSKSDENIVYFKTKNLSENVKNRIAEIQARQKRKIRSDAPVAIEYMITASPEALKRLTLNEQKKYWEECLKFIEARHGAKNRLSAVLHVDETTPHLHVLVFAERNNKLDAKSFFKLPELTKMQDDFADQVGKQFGFERGVKLSELLEKGEKPHRHQSVPVYKAKKLKETEQQLEQIETTIDKKKNELEVLYEAIDNAHTRMRTEVDTLLEKQLEHKKTLSTAQKLYDYLQDRMPVQEFKKLLQNAEAWTKDKLKKQVDSFKSKTLSGSSFER